MHVASGDDALGLVLSRPRPLHPRPNQGTTSALHRRDIAEDIGLVLRRVAESIPNDQATTMIARRTRRRSIKTSERRESVDTRKSDEASLLERRYAALSSRPSDFL